MENLIYCIYISKNFKEKNYLNVCNERVQSGGVIQPILALLELNSM